MLELKNISYYYKREKWVIRNLSWNIKEGYNRIGVVGENGSGKSTLLKAMARILHPQEGKVLLQGKDLYKISSRELSRLVSFLGPSNLLELHIPVMELVKFGRYPYLSFMSPLNKNDLKVVNWALDITDMTGFKDIFLTELSSGEKQRARLARALAQDTKFLLLDEPTTYLDPRHWVKLLEVLKDVSKHRYIIIASHDLSFLRLFAKYILCLKEGKIIYDGTPLNFWDSHSFTSAFGVEPERLKTGLRPEQSPL